MIKDIELLVIDVDGTLTDGGIYYDEHGNEIKKFTTKDAVGFFVAKAVGIKTMVLTGRACLATARRMNELKVDYLFQDVKNKSAFLEDFCKKNLIKKEAVGYVGDDLNDLLCMKMVGFASCPADSCSEIKKIADYVSPIAGGRGVVRDVVKHLLSDSEEWEKITGTIYGAGE